MAEKRRTVAVHNAHPRLRFERSRIVDVIRVLDASARLFRNGCPSGELSIALLTDQALAQIHADFMDDPTSTDVITFEGNREAGQVGEICISVDTAARYVGLQLDDKAKLSRRVPTALSTRFSTELTLYLIHGWLHLAGYDDLQPAKKRQMRAAEKRALSLLRAADALSSFRLS
jgi:probable rRNA maturation factor